MKFLLGWTRTFRRLSLSLCLEKLGIQHLVIRYIITKQKMAADLLRYIYISIYIYVMYLVEKYWQEKWTKKSLKRKMSEAQYESIILKTGRLY